MFTVKCCGTVCLSILTCDLLLDILIKFAIYKIASMNETNVTTLRR